MVLYPLFLSLKHLVLTNLNYISRKYYINYQKNRIFGSKRRKIERLNHFLPTWKEHLGAVDPPRRADHPYTPYIGEYPPGLLDHFLTLDYFESFLSHTLYHFVSLLCHCGSFFSNFVSHLDHLGSLLGHF